MILWLYIFISFSQVQVVSPKSAGSHCVANLAVEVVQSVNIPGKINYIYFIVPYLVCLFTIIFWIFEYLRREFLHRSEGQLDRFQLSRQMLLRGITSWSTSRKIWKRDIPNMIANSFWYFSGSDLNLLPAKAEKVGLCPPASTTAPTTDQCYTSYVPGRDFVCFVFVMRFPQYFIMWF